ncbi:MAG: peptidylprolyl isomerase [bacterium]
MRNKVLSLMGAVVTVFLLAILLNGCSAISKPAAIVNGEKISKEEVDQQLEKMYGKETLELLIGKKLIKQKAAKEGITVGPKDIDDRFEMIKIMDPFFEIKLKSSNLSADDIKKDLDIPLYLEKLVLKGATEKDQKELYDRMKDQLALVRARYIIANTESQAKEMLAELNKGTDFAKVAEKSIDPDTNTKGGDLGLMTRQAMMVKLTPEIVTVAFSQEPGKISKILKTQRGYAIVKVEEKKTSFQDLSNLVGMVYAQTKMGDFLKKIKDEASITYMMFQDKTQKADNKPAPGEKEQPAPTGK